MAVLPTKDKTWQYSNNTSAGNTATILRDYQNIMRLIKVALTSFGTLPWTVSGSSNSLAAGMDAVDRWTVDTDLVFGAGVHSWIVLRQTGIAAQFEICIDLGATQNIATVVASTVGFGTANGGTNGTTSARPTATDEKVILSNTAWASGTGSIAEHRVHVQQSTDGQCTRVFVSKTQTVYLLIIIDKPKNPITAWSTPWVAVWINSNLSATAGVTRLNDASVAVFKPTNSLAGATFYLGGTFVVSALVSERATGQIAQDVGGGRAFLPITLISDTVGYRGEWGELFDMYWTDITLTKATQFDASPSRAWTFIESLVIPWDGSTQVTA